NPAVRKLFNTIKARVGTPATGSFVTGATAIDALATAIRRAHGSTRGFILANQFQRFRGLPTISGPISFSAKYHTVFGRSYRVIGVQKNKGRAVAGVKAGTPATVGPCPGSVCPELTLKTGGPESRSGPPPSRARLQASTPCET